jgi:type I restriction enzyme S subunit
VGVIPEEWNVERLGRLADFFTSGSRGWAQFYTESGALFIRSQNVRDGRLTFEDVQCVSPPSGAEGNRTKVLLNDLLITITGNSVGNVAMVDQVFDEAYISQHVGLVRLREPGAAGYICRYLSPNSPGNPQIAGSQSGQSKPGLNLQNLRDFWIAVPATAEELHAIAAALSDMDALLAGLDRLIAKKRDLKQAAMQQLLAGQTRLPGFHGEWEVKRLGNLFDIAVGTSKTAFVTEEGDYWICDMGSVSVMGELIVSKRTNYHGDFLEVGDLVMPKDDIGGGKIIGKVGFVDGNGLYVLGDHVYRLRALEGDSRFLAYLINSHRTNSELRKKVVGSAQLGLGRRSVEEQEITVPPLPEQSAIATILSDMDTELSALEARRDKTHALKQAMMQELLTGKTRLV